MDVSILDAAQGGNPNWSNMDQITPADLADLWARGVTVAARLMEVPGKGATLKFGHADLIMVRIKLAHLPLATVLNAPFTQQHATVVAYSKDRATDDELLLAFQLPTPVMDGRKYVRLLAGLETLYAGSARHSCAEEGYGLIEGATAKALGGKLNADAVRYLDMLGTESKELSKGRGALLRSHVTLDRTTVVTLPGGETYPLEQLPKELEVFCPVHIGAVPTGIVHWYADGTPGVQCSHCQRTFAASTTQRNYDFGRFDRIINELAASDTASATVQSGLVFDPGEKPTTGAHSGATGVIRLTEHYLPPVALQRGATFIKSPKGSGKTQALEGFVAQCKKKHLRVLLLGHRRSLLQSISARLGLDCYFIIDDKDAPGKSNAEMWVFDDEGDLRRFPDPILAEGEEKTPGYRQVSPSKHYAICLDSMTMLDPEDEKRQYHVVIIDEAEQVFAHLTGETLKRQRREVFAKLSYYLRNAHQTVFLDADLNMITMSASFELLRPETPVQIIVNEPKHARGDIHLYSNRGQLAKLLTDTVGRGKKVYVATNSKKKAIDLGKLITAQSPGKRVAVITADNSQLLSTQELLGDITRRFEHDLDVLIASPAIGTGIDITFKGPDGQPRLVVDAVFGFFEANIITHFDIDQQLMRVRHPGEVHVWVDTTPMHYETDVGCIKRELEKTVRKTGYLLRYEDDGSPVFANDHGLVNIWAQVMAAMRGSKNRLADYFRTLRCEGGWNLVDVDYDEGNAQYGKVALAAAKESRLAERKERLLVADKLAEYEASKLEERDRRGAPLSDRERDALARYRIESFYADGDINPDLIDFDNEGRTREQVMRLECMASKREWFELRDEKDVADGLLAFDRRRYLVQRNVLESVLAASGVFDATTRKFKSGAVVEAASLTPFLNELEIHRRQFDLLFGLPLYADRWRKPIVQLKGVLSLIGLDLENVKTEQKGGKKVRRYSIAVEQLNRMMRAVRKRDISYQRDTAERPQGLEDKLTRSSSMNSVEEAFKSLGKGPKKASIPAEKKKAVMDAFLARAA